MQKKGSAPTMKDVAQEAGVALGTVSKVVNGIPVGRSYQKRVEAAIKKLDYHVNSYAQGLKARKTCTAAFLVPDTANPFFGLLTNCVCRALAARGYRMLLCCTAASSEMEQSLLTMAQHNKVDAIIALSYSADLSVQEGTRLVTIDRHIGPNVPCVASDNFAGGQMAARKLVELGCSRVLYMNAESGLPNEVSKRRDGFLSACATMGVHYDILDMDESAVFEEFTSFLERRMIGDRLEFDGIFCGTDTLAYRVIGFLRTRGCRVPEDVQVIGFDGVPNFATGAPLCSTIVQPVEQIAEVSVQLALSEDLRNAPPLVNLPVKYLFGGTTRE